MDKINSEMFRKHFRLAGVGAALQFLSGLFFVAAMIGAMKDMNRYVRQMLIQKLSETK